MARLDFKLPDIGEGIAEAEVVEWHAEIGDVVKEGQVIASVMTDKATVELEAPSDGILLTKGGELGDLLPVGTVLFALETADQEAPVAPASAAEEPSEEAVLPKPVIHTAPKPRVPVPDLPPNSRPLASPAVRQRARALGVDLSLVPTAGERVLHADLDQYIVARNTTSSRASALESPSASRAASSREIPVIGMRRQIARRMQEAKRHIPHFTYVDEVDVSQLERWRRDLNEESRDDAPLHFLPFLCLAVCHALVDFPLLNAHYDDQREVIRQFDQVHLGIATQTDQGLAVPVLRNADRLDLKQIARAIADLAQGARSGALSREELSGSTITISSLGKLGGLMATPIVNRPEVAILAPSRVTERIAMTAIGSAPRMIMNLSISCDHRVIDGFVAASFVQGIRKLLEQPALLRLGER